MFFSIMPFQEPRFNSWLFLGFTVSIEQNRFEKLLLSKIIHMLIKHKFYDKYSLIMI